ncbi:hypothetical protein [uncultured Roseobacter sp.]|uniref:hypothetical protein n=1 Tax=uncultured Roseobacter sp. TaxID=114847 RepID=UPI00260EFB11|nr:hypothetical protein [uncultured Roseobacter sp.]
MRAFLTFLCFATPTSAWEFTPGLPCLLTHTEPGVFLELTFDPSKPLYTITIKTPDPWPDADVFGLRFSGPAELAIATDQHELGHDNRSVTVADTGFGNVLNGLQFNRIATATLGDRAVSVSLQGAAEPVAAFRQCEISAGA